MVYENPKCNKCGNEIKFIPVRFYNGSIKNVPCELKDKYIYTRTDEKTDKGQFIWESTPQAVTHNCQGQGAPE